MGKGPRLKEKAAEHQCLSLCFLWMQCDQLPHTPDVNPFPAVMNCVSSNWEPN